MRASDAANELSLLIGIESDYITELDADGLGHLLQRNDDIDYVVGSVHHVNGVPIDFDRNTYLKSVVSVSSTPAAAGDTDTDPRLAEGHTPSAAQLEPWLCAYFDKQYALLQRHRPEVVGHFDLCRLYTPEVSFAAKAVWDRVRRNVEFAIGYGALFECNAAAIRKGWATSYPGKDVLDVS
jgi:histidinol-phosphatase (PHP family)